MGVSRIPIQNLMRHDKSRPEPRPEPPSRTTYRTTQKTTYGPHYQTTQSINVIFVEILLNFETQIYNFFSTEPHRIHITYHINKATYKPQSKFEISQLFGENFDYKDSKKISKTSTEPHIFFQNP